MCGGVSLFSQATSDNTFKLCQIKFRLNIKKSFFTDKAVKHWNRLSREVFESSFVEVYNGFVDVVIRNMV